MAYIQCISFLMKKCLIICVYNLIQYPFYLNEYILNLDLFLNMMILYLNNSSYIISLNCRNTVKYCGPYLEVGRTSEISKITWKFCFFWFYGYMYMYNVHMNAQYSHAKQQLLVIIHCRKHINVNLILKKNKRQTWPFFIVVKEPIT
jgi:hypothetical protein